MDRSRLLVILVLTVLQGCAATTDPGLLVPDASINAFRSDSPLHGNIALGEVQAEKPIDIQGFQRVGKEELAEALKRSLSDRGLLADPEQSAQYRLTAILADVALADQGGAATARVLMRYTLTLMQAFHPMRGHRVMEGSFRANIAEFLQRLTRFRPLVSASQPS